MRIRGLLALFLATTAPACSSDDAKSSADGGAPSTDVVTIDRSTYTDVGLDPLDYSDPNLWLCRPGIAPNECYKNFDTTVFLADGTSSVVKHERAQDPGFDCFYVYPTVDLVGTTNTTNFADVSHVEDALLSQAGRFSKLCEVYAPLYRQNALGAGGAAVPGAASDGGAEGGGIGVLGDVKLAYADVEASFKYYMAHYNKGRKFVLMGHSQGTFVLTALYQKLFEEDAGLRAQLISALFIGGAITVPEGAKVGGSFKTLPGCTTPGQTGCVIAYNSFAKEAPPPANAAFGRAAAGQQVLCTGPQALANNTGRSRMAYVPKVINTAAFIPNLPEGKNPDFATDWAGFPDLFQSDCMTRDGATYLEVALEAPPGDKRPIAPYRNTLTEGIGFGLHITDYNLQLDDLIEAVRLQSVAALKN
jgi:pimeloyl-ACP methyl ester carboxylesterase